MGAQPCQTGRWSEKTIPADLRIRIRINEQVKLLLKAFNITGQELQAEARKKLTKAEEDGTAERMHKRAVTRLRKQGIPTSSSFMVVKWKAIRGKQASAARVEWAEENRIE